LRISLLLVFVLIRTVDSPPNRHGIAFSNHRASARVADDSPATILFAGTPHVWRGNVARPFDAATLRGREPGAIMFGFGGRAERRRTVADDRALPSTIASARERLAFNRYRRAVLVVGGLLLLVGLAIGAGMLIEELRRSVEEQRVLHNSRVFGRELVRWIGASHDSTHRLAARKEHPPARPC